MPVNFGILQQVQTPQAQIVQTPNYAAQNQQQAMGVLDQIRQQRAQAMQEQVQQQSIKTSQQEMLQRQQEMEFAKQQQPGVLAQQGATLGQTQAGTALTNVNIESKKAEIAGMQYQIQLRQEAAAAYQKASKAGGGASDGLDAMNEVYLKSGDVDSYGKAVKVKKDMEDLKQAQTKTATDGLTGIGDITAQIHNSAKPAVPAHQDPQTGQMIPAQPEVTEIQGYTQKYPMIKKLYPDAPSPDSFKSNGQFIDTFSTPVLATAGPVKAQQVADLKAKTENDVYKANKSAEDAMNNLKQIVRTKGANSPEAIQAATAYKNAKADAARLATGNNFVTGTVKNSFNAVKESLGFGDTPENLANQASDTPVQPTTPTPTQIGTGKVIVPGTNTEVPIDAVHAEIARRAAAKGIK